MAARVKPAASKTCQYLVSACLAGARCTYKGGDNLKRSVKELVNKGEAITACPEVLGGLSIPRERIELIGGGGEDILNKRAKAITPSGNDVSDNLVRGANAALRLIKRYNIKKAILKSNSPSCGSEGVLTALLRRYKVELHTEK